MSQVTTLTTPIIHTNSSNNGAAGDRKYWANLHGSSSSLALYQAARQAQVPFVLITHDTPSALKYEQELQQLNHDQLTICLFPDWETLPFDSFSPHQDIISQRLATLYQLTNLKRGIVIVPISTLSHRLAPKQYLKANSLMVKVGDNKDLHQLRQDLEASGYRHVDQVMEHGEFSARGAILDLFPMGSPAPLPLRLLRR